MALIQDNTESSVLLLLILATERLARHVGQTVSRYMQPLALCPALHAKLATEYSAQRLAVHKVLVASLTFRCSEHISVGTAMQQVIERLQAIASQNVRSHHVALAFPAFLDVPSEPDHLCHYYINGFSCN